MAKKKVPDLIESFKNKATMFFEKAKSFELKADGTLREYRETFNQFFAEDQLRSVLTAKLFCTFYCNNRMRLY